MRRAVLSFVMVALSLRADATPPDTEPAPLLVVLHGNNETAAERAERWRDSVEKRGWKLLALDCPRRLGCNAEGQWYEWNGSPQWVFEQVRDVASRERIDPARIYLAGWSGGATYIGRRMPAWPRMFAGVVLHGGGIAPHTTQCPERRIPAYFLVGDENPAHGAARQLRVYLERCDQPIEWDLLPGANHAAEDAALTPAKIDEILSWFDSLTPRGWS